MSGDRGYALVGEENGRKPTRNCEAILEQEEERSLRANVTERVMVDSARNTQMGGSITITLLPQYTTLAAFLRPAAFTYNSAPEGAGLSSGKPNISDGKFIPRNEAIVGEKW